MEGSAGTSLDMALKTENEKSSFKINVILSLWTKIGG
jgi:hypothetical protein